MSINRRMRLVLEALSELEKEWAEGPMPPARTRRYFDPEHLKECRDVWFFKVGVIDRLNAMFAQHALASRYGMSKRAVEDACEFNTFQGIDN